MKRKLQITGKGKLAVSPDIIILSFEASAHEWEYEKTVDALNRKVEELRRIAAEVGVERKNLKTKDFSIRKETTRNKKTDKYEFNGFRASHSLELELPLDKNIINQLLARIAKGMDHLDFSIAFGVKDAAKQQQQLILQAIAKAKENATLIAGATGVELLDILDIDYSYRELTIRSHRHDYQLYEADMMTTYDATPDFEPDDIDVTETVTITWRIG
ncbi:SIMPL domain-containing protein [Pontibacter anaerobius]|uniref:SIMPL domain-containing protein n=1 Tax=Pontibacter anaerobius TaxID=2993940 RepID=A0ABT3RDC1_9BACT|nr:SIMPL domain-containing protein [Pontibacter anaerobius]MCX2739838.1 SIMPL domain-containing protein [Pontibacter anaerobius]